LQLPVFVDVLEGGVSNLKCTIDPGEVKQNSGGGANCDYAQPN
jgi:hypothetical protein